MVQRYTSDRKIFNPQSPPDPNSACGMENVEDLKVYWEPGSNWQLRAGSDMSDWNLERHNGWNCDLKKFVLTSLMCAC